jgi:hypothetical protein
LKINLEIASSTLVILGAHNIKENDQNQERFRINHSSYIIHPNYVQSFMTNEYDNKSKLISKVLTFFTILA